MLEEMGWQSPGSCGEVVFCSGGSSRAAAWRGGGAILATGKAACSLLLLAFACIPDAILILSPSARRLAHPASRRVQHGAKPSVTCVMSCDAIAAVPRAGCASGQCGAQHGALQASQGGRGKGHCRAPGGSPP